jgi:hypothetical protein
VASGSADGLGAYEVTIEDVTAGDHTYAVVVTDACGRASAATSVTAEVVVTPDPPGPVVPVSGTDHAASSGVPAGDALAAKRIFVMGDLGASLPDCQTSPFTAYVGLAKVKRVVFRVDGVLLRVVRKPNRYGVFLTKIYPSRFSRGEHRLTGRVTLKGGAKRTVNMTFRRCGVCTSRRAFSIHVPYLAHGERAVRAVVTVNGKQVRVVKGKRLRAKVVLAGLPKGTYVVRIRATTNRGRVFKETRRFRTCVKGSPKRS